MLINLVADFVEFLTQRRQTLEATLSHLTLRILTPLQATSVLLVELKENGSIEVMSSFGLATDFFDIHPRSVKLFERTPMTDAIRYRKTVWVNTLPHWGDDYPLLNELNYSYPAQTFICWSIESAGIPCACIGVFCDANIAPSGDYDVFLKALSNVMSLYFFHPLYAQSSPQKMARRLFSDNQSYSLKELTERQLLILKLMAQGKTNIAISDAMGYSESTIRQETIKIYSTLRCMGRQEAIKIYIENFERRTV